MSLPMKQPKDNPRPMTQTPGTSGLVLEEGLLNEISTPGRFAYSLPRSDVPSIDPTKALPGSVLRAEAAELPEISELQVVRHFTRLSTWNFSIDTGFVPLGSCTMKYNPRINEAAADILGFANLHPHQPAETMQGALHLMAELQRFLAAISGLPHISLLPAAGSQGELTGLMMIRACLTDRGNTRKKVLIPDSAHGTNPASAAICGYDVVQINSSSEGTLDPSTVANAMDDDVAALMITNPNTLGLFEKDIQTICHIVHDKGGFVYCDGANLNALMGITQLAATGIDVMHFNLHKTFTTPHGGGGPGSGPIGFVDALAPFQPYPILTKDHDTYAWTEDAPQSIGRIKAFYGNFGMFVRAYTYIREMGGEGLKRATQFAVLNANYMREQLRDCYHLPYSGKSLHECVFSDKWQQKDGVTTRDIAKRLLDHGFHPPTVYFPLLVPGALMIEPTETEAKLSCDAFISAMRQIADEAKTSPDVVTSAPHNTFRRRLDEVGAARKPILTWKQLETVA